MILTHSPSSLALARSCKRSWALKYLYKIYPEFTYTKGKTWGTIIHNSLDLYLRGGKLTDVSFDTLSPKDQEDVGKYFVARRDYVKKDGTTIGSDAAEEEVKELFRTAPQRALAGVHYLPPPSDVEWHDTESKIITDTTRDGLHPQGSQVTFSNKSRLDYMYYSRSRNRVVIVDHKSTVGKDQGEDKGPWAYVPTEEQILNDDAQAVIYPASIMQRLGVNELDFEFIYYYTGDGPPQGTMRRYTLTRERVWHKMHTVWLPLCDELQALADEHERNPINIGLLPAPADLVSNQSPCRKFRGCPYHNVQCHPPTVTREQILAHIAPQKKETHTMTNPLTAMLNNPPPMVAPLVPLHVPPVGYAAPVMPVNNTAPALVTPYYPPATHAPPVMVDVIPPYYPPAPEASRTQTAAPNLSYGVPLPAGQTVSGNFGPAAAMVAEVNAAPLAFEAQVAPALPEPTPPAAEKPKRVRRTKAEIEAATGASLSVRPDTPQTRAEDAAADAALAQELAESYGTEGTIPTLHTADPLEALLWAARKSGGKVTITVTI